MSRRRPNDRTTSRRSTRRTLGGLSTAFLLPDLHPWLKEYFADRNLVALEDEVWQVLPAWEPVPERRVESGEWRVVERQTPMTHEALTPSQSTSSNPEVTPNYQLSTINSQLPNGVRRSETPVPFVIPVHAAAPPPSRHLLRIARLHAAPSTSRTPDLLASFLRQGLEPLRNPGGLLRVSEPAPMVRIPSPWNELLIVNVIGGTLGVLWRDALWPLWSALRLPHPRTLKRSFELRVKSYELRSREFAWRRRSPDALFRIQGIRERSEQFPRSHQLFPLPSSLFTINFRPAFTFALVLFVILLPLKLLDLHAQFPAIRGRVLSATAEAIGTFRAGGSAIARSSFDEAIADFDRARAALERIPRAAGTLSRAGIAVGRHLPGLRSTLGRAEEGRRAGIALAEASAAATRGLRAMDGIDLTDPSAAAFLDAATAAFTTARQQAEEARSHIDVAAPNLTGTVNRAIGELRRAEQLLPILRALGGIDRPRRLLLVFQNPAELRPTGGFMGSVALVDVAGGRVTALELPPGGTYDLSGITRLRVIPPEPLRLVSTTWQFHDANWFPDFPTSARKLRWFYEASGGPSVDAVVAVNAPVLEDILALTGPITAGDQTFSATAVRAILTDTIES
ncbi:DUF4012 domain-containing protein, partial [Candidatus Uhrbacteria bacterium]|nr:DUF4012 domain-containing protein [Candidatus Uhrbacteria bacterium]